MTSKNQKSMKWIVAMGLGENLCKEHAALATARLLALAAPRRGVCYVCAINHGEPVRG